MYKYVWNLPDDGSREGTRGRQEHCAAVSREMKMGLVIMNTDKLLQLSGRESSSILITTISI